MEDCGVGTAGAPSVPLPLCPGRIGARLKGFRNRRSENALLLQGGDPGAVCAPQLCRAVPLPSCCGPTSELSAFGSSSACSPTGPRSFASGRQRTAPLSPGPTVLCWPGPALQLTSLTAASPRAETSGPGHELPGSAAGPKVPHRGRRLSQCGRSFGVTAAGGHCMDCGQVRVLRGCRGAALCCAVLCCAALLLPIPVQWVGGVWWRWVLSPSSGSSAAIHVCVSVYLPVHVSVFVSTCPCIPEPEFPL